MERIESRQFGIAKTTKRNGEHMAKAAIEVFEKRVQEFKDQGLYKNERVLTGMQRSRINTTKVTDVINMCANNYLGLCDDTALIETAKASYDDWGFGLSSVRFICGTQEIHKKLEKKVSGFFGFEDAILYSSCFDANTGLFETLLTSEDAIVSDELNHASIIDGVRLCKAKRYRYKNNNMDDLKRNLESAKADGARIILIATDGVFSMDGIIANLQGVCDLAEAYGALVMVDDSHSSGFVGDTGRGTAEHCGVQGRVDILTSTFGKALGGASGGFTASSQVVVDLLRQASRPYLFSNTLSPAITATTLKVLEMLEADHSYVKRLQRNTEFFRKGLEEISLDIVPGVHPIVPVMVYDAQLASKIAERMLELGVYVTAFSFPVVPRDKARIRTQVSAVHSREELEFVLTCFAKVKDEFGL